VFSDKAVKNIRNEIINNDENDEIIINTTIAIG
jgi:hypothetical protein